MAGFSKIADGFALDSPENVDFSEDLVVCSKGSFEGDKKESVECMFNQVVSAFLSERCGGKCFKPLPPMLGNGQAVDLYKLYVVVRDKGGYEFVSENGMWGCVAKECGLSLEFGSCLKLVYVKYLDSIGEWMERTVNGKDLKDKLGDSEEVHSVNVMDSESEKDGERVHLDLESKLGDSEAVQSVRVRDFESDTRGFISGNLGKDEKDGEQLHLDLEETKSNITSGEMLCKGSKVWRFADLDEAKRNVINMLFESSEEGELDESKCQNEVQSSVQLHENERIGNDKKIDDAKTCDVNFNNNRTEDVNNRKRKREGIQGILNWVANVAKDPCNPIVGSLPERSKWKYFGNDQRWKQILLVRQAMMVKRTASSSVEQSIWQKKQKMHPAMYEDHSVSARLSRGLSFKKSQAQLCSETAYPGMQGDLEDTFGRPNLRLAESLSGLWIKNFNRKRVPVGEYFQAEVPEWDEKSCESDSKWLGTRVWPQEAKLSCNSLIERERTGLGRHDSCGCEFQGSFECVRFHVSEKKIRLKLELGMAFYHWHIDKMGEEVAFSWNKVDEIKFEAIIKLNPPSEGKCFWEEIHKLFPYKNREQLVSYYFNVFLLRRRGQQNRSIPIDISSDDDDLEFETTTNCSGQRAVKSLKPNYCSPKKTHLNFRGNSRMG
ncbi:AT-rich interactive domain-containing protein 1-like [Heracleum sosnowskyi]|uniref:AT-rich interactive domain-containing protein 1-like n=1 Tax=Heracleum sosnowskyi TaxID=360622 RepID=A0AAD8I3H5_9APIA|nr:AT-rich interactive domain-containing protein 1-like [Heracleum sosnowskyi]